ncbi:ThuA domain-containing protein (plasmid) [Coraliomargarita sp. W4R53]
MDAVRENPPRAVIASGSGRYGDPWHPFASTSASLAAILDADGWQVTVNDDVDHALTLLDGVDLLVVNAGDPSRNNPADATPLSDSARAAATNGLAAAIDRGIGLIATHTALASLRDYPLWREAIGGSWESGTSWHPPIADSLVSVIDSAHVVTAGLSEFTLFDEMYSALVVDDDIRVLAEHTLDGAPQSLVWVKETPTRSVVSALGHDARAYESPQLRAILTRAARWAAGVAD